jgi:CysZ protein
MTEICRDFVKGIMYNLRGLRLGIKTRRLFFLGLIRFLALIIITVICASMVLIYHDDILNIFWAKPASIWICWLWHLVSWGLSFMLVGVSVIISYLISQVLFSAIIMDLMSRITEKMVTDSIKEPKWPVLRLAIYLTKQEIPRAVIPILFSLLIILLGWITPLGPVLLVISPLVTVVFLAWDNTDIVPARRLIPFKDRFRALMKSIPFHLGFGLIFLLPVINIVFLSFAPVGATLYSLDYPLDESV